MEKSQYEIIKQLKANNEEVLRRLKRIEANLEIIKDKLAKSQKADV